MVVEAGEKLHLFGAGAMVDGIVKDEHVDAICMSQGSERVIDDGVAARVVVNLRQWIWQEFMKR